MRVPFQNLMEKTKRNFFYASFSVKQWKLFVIKSRDSEKVMMTYSRMAIRILAEFRPSASHASSTTLQPHHIHIQNIALLSCPSQRNAIHGYGSLHYKADEQVIEV